MNKIFNSSFVIVAVIIVGTIIYFTGWGSETGIAFSEGKLVLKIRDQDEKYKDGGVTGTWTVKNMMPGDRWVFKTPFLKTPFVGLLNEGDELGNYLEIACDYTVTEEKPCFESDTDCQTNDHPEKMAEQLIITKSIYFGTEEQGDKKKKFCIDALEGKKYRFFNPHRRSCFGVFTSEDSNWKIEDLDGDEKITFLDLENDKLENLPPPNKKAFYIMDLMFDANANNDFQGDTFNLEMNFTLQ